MEDAEKEFNLLYLFHVYHICLQQQQQVLMKRIRELMYEQKLETMIYVLTRIQSTVLMLRDNTKFIRHEALLIRYCQVCGFIVSSGVHVYRHSLGLGISLGFRICNHIVMVWGWGLVQGSGLGIIQLWFGAGDQFRVYRIRNYNIVKVWDQFRIQDQESDYTSCFFS